MMIKDTVIWFMTMTLIKHTITIPWNSYYLIDINTNSTMDNISYCTNLLIKKDLYYIPSQCHKHLLCDPYNCDDQSFRCVKIRETLCCLYEYIQRNCQKENFKEKFRSVYFHTSIQHGYCEINLERIEKNDHSYCIANHLEMTTTTTTSMSLKRSHRYRQRLSTISSSYSRHETTTISSKSSFIHVNVIILFLSVSL